MFVMKKYNPRPIKKAKQNQNKHHRKHPYSVYCSTIGDFTAWFARAAFAVRWPKHSSPGPTDDVWP
jgi:hypothetical protein